jgi:hypothetical protein
MSNKSENRNEELGLKRLATRITREAMEKLRAECERRYRLEAAHVPLGKVVSELIAQHLPADSQRVKRKPAKNAA